MIFMRFDLWCDWEFMIMVWYLIFLLKFLFLFLFLF